MNKLTVAILYARSDSIYNRLEGCDVWDAQRDARNWPGGAPVIAHPPCRAWGRLAHFAKPQLGEKDLAVHALRMVRENGGVLEHPEHSRLWKEYGMPAPGKGRDAYGGWTLAIDQRWFGHRANKATWLYICRVQPRKLPEYPLRIDEGTHYIMCDRRGQSRNRWKLRLPTAERETTPLLFAKWLVETARLVSMPAPSGFLSASHKTYA